MDGGIVRGTDVFKALALGARAVFIGRPVLWGLSHSGEEGVFNVLKLLNDEFALAMKLSGCICIEVLNRGILFPFKKIQNIMVLFAAAFCFYVNFGTEFLAVLLQ